MMHRLLLPLLALGLWQIAYTQIHCGFEPPACQEGACQLCHLGDISPLASGSAQLCSPAPTPRASVAPSRGATLQPLLRRNRGRAPPR